MNISIALATYNGARYLQEQLDSFVGQTRLPDELVVCDDHSTDETISILERFQKRAPFPVSIWQNAENIGVAQNFGKAIGLCQGNLIFLSDQDDFWFPEKLATMESVIDGSTSSPVLICDMEIADHELNATELTLFRRLRSLGLDEDLFENGCGMAFHENLKALILPIPHEAMHHDVWINTIALAIGSKRIIKKPLQFYRRHKSNVSHWIGSTSRIRLVDRIELRPVRTLPSAYARRRDMLGILAQRLMDLDPENYIKLGSARPFREVIAKLQSERAALSLRGTLLESGWLRRKTIAIELCLKGDYQYFRGWKSFARDMFR
jgi:glycosyltransferase involved in cell wall biosynthesis